MRVAIGQFNATVGAFRENADRIAALSRDASAKGATLLVLPEQAIPGYPARDFLTRHGFVAKNVEALEYLAKATASLPISLYAGFAEPHPGRGTGVHNAAAWLRGGRTLAVARKILLPSYDVFDETRYFDPGEQVRIVDHEGVKIALTICEDLWNDKTYWRQRRYERDPVEEAVAAGAQLVINASASPFEVGKPQQRERMLAACARRHRVPIVYCNLVGGNDALIFDGRSLVVGKDGEILARGKAFEEDLLIVDVEPTAAGTKAIASPPPAAKGSAETSSPRHPVSPFRDGAPSDEDLDDLLRALGLGLRDYLRKTGFEKVVLGLSGGIDSALTAALAVSAIGAENVIGVALPSQYTSQISKDDAAALAENLGIRFETLSIEPAFEAFKETLAPVLEGRTPTLTYENLQARSRGVLLMALSNELGALLLTTGNKSESAVGYCTLYGDMAGGLNLLGDLPKIVVYALSRYVNRDREVIPSRTISRPPSAELREGQTDQDSLPPYEVLDRIIAGYVVEGRSADELVAAGEDEAVVRRVRKLVRSSEFKRRQAAPSLKVTPRAFGEAWRYPIAQGYDED
ncbi:NAD+ synthase [Vulgatibacter incomptus]|uniref:Glutamine-dependent NAD(+) synthetase n=1 Tax=Vulgatibacter incomptus TaxID=1391653 RepID=A0A0K1PCV2_9BACT|nr:NAD+ synthase [Vulgatibacter incomptus]AKU91226.1 NAD synthetase [Vulgatibacter incomptus]